MRMGERTGEEESSCKLQASGVELNDDDDDAVAGWPRIGGERFKARPTLQRPASKLPVD